MKCPQCAAEVTEVKWRRPDIITIRMPTPHKGPCGLPCKGGMFPSPELAGPFHVVEGCVTCARKAARAASAAAAPKTTSVSVQPPPVAAPVPPKSEKAKAKA